jgi:transposase
VAYGLQHRSLEGTYAIGIDEIHVRKKNTKFWTLVYQIDEGRRRLLWVGKGRSKKTLHGFFDSLSDSIRKAIKVVCSDMCRAYVTVVAKRMDHALQILDRFHIRKMQNEAVNDIRKEEAKAMAEAGLDPLLKKPRWIFLKNRRNWTRKEKQKAANLRSFRAFVLVETFNHFWNYKSPTWAGKFLDQWCRKVAWSKLEPLNTKARTLKEHRPLLLNYFKARKAYSSGAVEGLNNKVKLVIRKSYGFRTDEALELALFHSLGKLPEPELTHRFF